MTYGIIDVVKDTLNGTVEYVTREEKKRRLDICLSCEHLKKLARQCSLCGCFIDMKTKYTESECPGEKW